MEISKATIGVVAASCITVGAAGAFLISRSAAPTPASPSAPAAAEAPKAAALEPIKPATPEPPARVEPPAPKFTDLVVSTDSVLGLQMETSVSSERARVEDEVVARVTRDVRVGDRVAIPAGARAY